MPAVESALKNVRSAGVADIVTVQQQDFRKFTAPAQKSIIVTNPPYGERLTPPDILGLYQAIGKVLKNEFQGGEAWIISSKAELFEDLGLRPSLKTQIFNGKLDCDFRKYQLFSGKLSDFRAEGGKVKTDVERRLMSDQRRFRTNRDEFKKRFDDAERHDEDDDLDPAYKILRRKHREFEQLHAPRKSKREGDDAKKGGFKKGGFKKDGFKKGDFKKGDSKKGGFGGKKREGGFKKGPGFKQKGDFKRKAGFDR